MAGDREPRRLWRLGVAIPLWASVVSLVAFGIVGGVVVLGARSAASGLAESASRQMAELTRARLVQVMQSGASREAVEQAARSALGSAGRADDFVVRLHSRPTTAVTKAVRPTAGLAWVFATGRETATRDGDQVTSYFPVAAQGSCLACHPGTASGDLMAVLEVSHDLGPDLEPQRDGLLLLLLGVLPFPIVLAFVASRRLTRRLARSVRVMREGTRKVARGEDLEAPDLALPDVAYVELDSLFREVRGLAEALQETRDLRFQVSALDALTITAETIKDWRDEVSRIAAALRRALPVRALVTAFAFPGGGAEVVIFWNGPASTREREALVSTTRARWEGVGAAPAPTAFEHVEVPAPTADAVALPEVEACDPSFLGSRVARVGGVTMVGLALAGGFLVRPLVLRGVLSTLLNSVGALRAVDGYARQIEYHATRDALTSLPNRRMLLELLTYEVERARRHGYQFAVLVLDLDGFKQVNDTYGHAFGDAFLVAVSGALRDVARTEDVLARYGGDEFVMIASGADAERVRLIAGRMLERVASFSLAAPDGTILGAGVSIGAAIYPHDGDTADAIFRRADAEMYRAKAAGKGRLRVADEA